MDSESDITQEDFALASEKGSQLNEVINTNTVKTLESQPDTDFDEEEFFTTEDGYSTLVTRYDLEQAISSDKKTHFKELQRYWVNKPYAFVSIFRSTRENEIKYYAIEPHLTDEEKELKEYIETKIRDFIKYDDDTKLGKSVEERKKVIREKIMETITERYSLYKEDESSTVDKLKESIPFIGDKDAGEEDSEDDVYSFAVRPKEEREESATNLSTYQVEKLIYYIQRDAVGFQKIDPVTHDINIEDISCDGYNSPVFVYHGDYEQIISNIITGEKELDDFVIKLAQRSGKGISKRNPQVDVTLPDGSRGQLTLGAEVSDHGTNYTIRQFKDVPFTPIDLINWRTFSLDQIAFLWLCIQNHKSLLFAGGTASGKTTSLNAVSLFIPSSGKIVSIEDTREVELPQRNWIASVTRPSFTGDGKGDVDEFDLLEAALRQRPDYIVMGEIRGEEGRTLFQVMSTGHTSYSTFHADSVGEVIKRFTTDPINVSKTMFTALDLISIQSSTRVNENKVRRNMSLTEVNHYDSENDEINVRDVYQWQAETDSFIQSGDSQVLQDIKFDKGWDRETLQTALDERKMILAYLIKNGLNTYAEVAATFQAYMNDRQTILTLISEDRLANSLDDLRQMESVFIDIDPEEEERTPRPGPDDGISEECDRILRETKDIRDEYEGKEVSLESAIPSEDQVKQSTQIVESSDATPESIEKELGLFDNSNTVDKNEFTTEDEDDEITVIEG